MTMPATRPEVPASIPTTPTAFEPLHPADPMTLAGVLVVTLLAAVIGPKLPTGAGFVALLLAVLAVVGWAAPTRGRQVRIGTALAAVPALLLMIRSSPTAALVSLGCWWLITLVTMSTVHGPPAWSLGPWRALARAAGALVHGILGPAYVLPAAVGALSGRRQGRHVGAVFRGALIAVPLVWIIASLLSFDQLFDQLITPVLPRALPAELVGRAVWALVVGWSLSGLFRMAACPAPADSTIRRRIGTTEALTVLAPLTLLFALFTGIQVYATVIEPARVLAATGISYAEYARQGFFQLLTVSVIALGVITTILGNARLDHDGRLHRAVRVFGLLTVAGIIAIVAIALHRLDLYGDVFGLTQLRLWSTVSALAIALCFVLVGVRLATFRPGAQWLFPGMVAVGMAVALGAVVASPDAIIARRNIDLSVDGTRSLDIGYLLGLSDDAVPTIVDAIQTGRVADADAKVLLESYCGPSEGEGVLSFNAARHRASSVLDRVCS